MPELRPRLPSLLPPFSRCVSGAGHLSSHYVASRKANLTGVSRPLSSFPGPRSRLDGIPLCLWWRNRRNAAFVSRDSGRNGVQQRSPQVAGEKLEIDYDEPCSLYLYMYTLDSLWLSLRVLICTLCWTRDRKVAVTLLGHDTKDTVFAVGFMTYLPTHLVHLRSMFASCRLWTCLQAVGPISSKSDSVCTLSFAPGMSSATSTKHVRRNVGVFVAYDILVFAGREARIPFDFSTIEGKLTCFHYLLTVTFVWDSSIYLFPQIIMSQLNPRENVAIRKRHNDNRPNTFWNYNLSRWIKTALFGKVTKRQ